jgi:hypothetical protein
MFQFKAAVTDSALRDRIVDNLSQVLGHLHTAVAAMPHKDGVDQWHAALLTRIISQWYEQQYSEEFMNMLASMFPSTASGEPVLDLGSWLEGSDAFNQDNEAYLALSKSSDMHADL